MRRIFITEGSDQRGRHRALTSSLAASALRVPYEPLISTEGWERSDRSCYVSPATDRSEPGAGDSVQSQHVPD